MRQIFAKGVHLVIGEGFSQDAKFGWFVGTKKRSWKGPLKNLNPGA